MTPITWTPTVIKLCDLKPWERNPKTIVPSHAKRLLKNWKDLGQWQTIAVSLDGTVVDGHQRLNVLKAAYGDQYEVKALQADRELTDKERERIVIEGHAGSVGSWNWDELSAWAPADLVEFGFDADLMRDWKRDITGLGMMIEAEKPHADAEPQVDRADELQKKWGCKTGDLWRIGSHRLLCGDSTKREDVDRVMMGEKAGACVTDSPYGINQEGIENDDPEGLRKLFDGVLKNMPIENGVIINFQSPRLFPVWLDAIRAHGHKTERALWFYDEADVTFPWRGWLMTSQIAIVSSVGKPAFSEGVYHHDCYIVKSAGQQDDSLGHPTAKPLDVIQELVSHLVGVVYEPFAGSGTTLVACQNLSRKARAIEISPAYCAVILERMFQAFPGIEIELM